MYKEICTETVSRWKDYLEDKFNVIFPYYNELLKTAQIEYERTINYNLTETFTHTTDHVNTLTGNTNQNGSSTNSQSVDNVLDNTNQSNGSNTNTSTLESNSHHEENSVLNKNETVTEENIDDKTSTKTNDSKKVSSDTPNGLLSIGNIENDVYASKAEFDKIKDVTTDKDILKGTKTDKNIENTDINSNDSVNSTSTDNGSNSNTQTIKETSSSSVNGSGSATNLTTVEQNASGKDIEDYTKVMRGSFGVITEADMLQKSINLQKTLSNILLQFFDECNDLFMLVY
jgi:hypothetical protein